MKNLLFSVALLLIAACVILSAAVQSNQNAATIESLQPADSPIEGAWELVWGKYGDNIRNPGRPYQFKQFTDKHFSMIYEGTEGKWNLAFAGKYELNGNIYKETVGYGLDGSQNFIGYSLEWKYEVRGDTLIMTGPIKATQTDGTPWNRTLNNTHEIRVRAK